MNIITREDWNAQPPNRSYVEIPVHERPGTETHHSVGLYQADNPYDFAFRLQRDHLGRDWTDAFYNWAIWLDGRIIQLRPDWAKSGPVESLTICFAGNYDTFKPTATQKLAWHHLRNTLVQVSPSSTEVRWHGQRARVGCPGATVIEWLKSGYPLPRSYNMLVYARVGPDRDAVNFADTHIAVVPGVVTSDKKEAERAVLRGETVFAVGGGSARDVPGAVPVYGANRMDTAKKVLDLAANRWRS